MLVEECKRHRKKNDAPFMNPVRKVKAPLLRLRADELPYLVQVCALRF